MNTPSSKNKIVSLILAIVIIGGTVSAGMFFYIENQKTIVSIGQAETDLNLIRERIKKLPVLREQTEEFGREFLKLTEFIPSKEGQAQVIMELEQIAKDCGVDIIDCVLNEKPRGLKRLPSYQAFKWQVSIRGNYQKTSRFLESVSESGRFILVSDLAMNATADEANHYILTTVLTLDLLTRKSQEKVDS